MKSIKISKNTVSLSDFKNRASKTLADIRNSHELLVVTQSGKTSAVLISLADYDLLTERFGFVDSA